MGVIRVTGRLICKSDAEARIVEDHLGDHIRLTREETGCLRFEVTRSDSEPMVWMLDEAFTDRSAFEAHQNRTRTSHWGRVSVGIERDFRVTEGD